jgi:hypothetical protein
MTLLLHIVQKFTNKVKRCQATGLILVSARTHRWYLLTEEKLYKIGAGLGIPPRKSYTQLPQQLGVSASS